ncbi:MULTISPECIES: ATP-dependent Clp protease adaptor ClpS [Amycolatopsis]|uniref:ATP-dependent Clp protease adaptor ClpS n=1 Tax=Amycolatopsis thermalba TaxID=944492 RepID=A0ABY4NSK6_9PSEU|nr:MULTISPECIES: ATP-dependent Clp protease adaptor ClpS [Amycolatopsis]OXM61466.1 ATP-dependent Clp protease adaptor ClpS [Amycolatopsis sp. KNN50.9b]UQS23064.1 ATP-dependent Clp protease adaptor ClpS [Amycolatopsis thermalba]
MAVKREREWAVVVHNDHVNSYQSVVYALHGTLGMPVERGMEFAGVVHHQGIAELTRFASRDQAEALVAELQVLGLHATLQGV